jgi:hypothetical protein
MFESLGTGLVHRTMTVADLNIPYPPDGADPLTAAGFRSVGSNSATTADSADIGITTEVQNSAPGATMSFTVVQHPAPRPFDSQANRGIRLEVLDAALAADRLGPSDSGRPANALLGVDGRASVLSQAFMRLADADAWDSDASNLWNDRSDRWLDNDPSALPDPMGDWQIRHSADFITTESAVSDLLTEKEGEGTSGPSAEQSGTIDPSTASTTATLDSAFAALGFFSVASGFGTVGRYARPVLCVNDQTADSELDVSEALLRRSTSLFSRWRSLWTRWRK